ncbi:MAG: alpha-xylosidase, partial [Dysgonamonadaceae bacterium]|nr:alpha-xylosidase [Dysgonamonadaceae bacterium]
MAIQTNYQLFDFLNFHPALNEGDRLWRACIPADIREQDGDIFISVPFQKQNNSNEITPDLSVSRQNYILRIRALGEKILRVSIAFDGQISETSEMLQLDEKLKQNPLSFEKNNDEWLIKDRQGNRRAVVNFREPEKNWWSDLQPAPQETIDLRFFPDGKKEVKLTDYDMFSPTRHDAFALAFVEKNGQPHRTTCSFHSQPDECFMGTC